MTNSDNRNRETMSASPEECSGSQTGSANASPGTTEYSQSTRLTEDWYGTTHNCDLDDVKHPRASMTIACEDYFDGNLESSSEGSTDEIYKEEGTGNDFTNSDEYAVSFAGNQSERQNVYDCDDEESASEKSAVHTETKIPDMLDHDKESNFGVPECVEDQEEDGSAEIIQMNVKYKIMRCPEVEEMIDTELTAVRNVRSECSQKDTHTGNKDRRPYLYVCETCGKSFGSTGHLKDHRITHTGEYPVSCGICHKGFLRTAQLNLHTMRHHTNKEHEAQHQETQSLNQKNPARKRKFIYVYVCETCGKTFGSTGHLKEHKLSHSGEYSVRCGICDKGFLRTAQLDLHTKRHHLCKEQIAEAQHQESGIPNEKVAEIRESNHYAKFEGNKVDGLEDAQEYSGQGGMPVRGRGKGRTQCPHCGKAFRSASHLKEHMITHTGEYPLKCSICGKGCRRQQELVMHQRRYHPSPLTINPLQRRRGRPSKKDKVMVRKRCHVCETCGKAFQNACNLKEHEITHTGEYPIRCEVCKTGFRRHHHPDKCMDQNDEQTSQGQNDKTEIHSQKAAGFQDANVVSEERLNKDKPARSVKRGTRQKQSVVCETCSKAFSAMCHLKEHMMIHTGDYPHRCSLCNKGFRRHSEFNLHMKRHDASKKIYKSKLQNLESSHEEPLVHNQVQKVAEIEDTNNVAKKVKRSTDKPECVKQGTKQKQSAVCETCGKAFSSLWHLKEHTMIHTGDYLHRCSLCNKGFRRRSEFHLHMKRHDANKKKYNTKVQNSESNHEEPQVPLQVQKVAEIEDTNNVAKKVKSSTDKPECVKQGTKQKQSAVCETCGKAFSSLWHLKEHTMIHTGDYPHRCSLCNKGFRRRSEFHLHMKRHDANKKIYNTKVQNSESNHEEPQVHNQVHRVTEIEDTNNVANRPESIKQGTKKKQSPVCETCGKAFSSLWHLKEHMMIHTGDYPHRCSLCNKGFRRRGEHKIHMKRHGANKKINKQQPNNEKAPEVLEESKSQDCKDVFHVTHVEIKKEHDGMDGDKVCDGEEVNVSNAGVIFREEQNPLASDHDSQMDVLESGKQRFACPKCNRSYAQQGHLRDHLFRHEGEFPIKCGLCKKGFFRRRMVIRHLWKEHYKENGWEFGDIVPHRKSAEVKEPSEGDVQENVETEGTFGDPERKKVSHFVCNHCDKIFDSQFRLELHLITYTKQQMFKCKGCKGVFLKETELEQHIESSEDCEKTRTNSVSRVKCNQCNRYFQSKSFQTHSCAQNTCIAPKSKACSVCGRVFTKAQSCIMHMKTHFKTETVFRCSLCDKTYKSNTGLLGHNDRFHRDGPKYTCKICGLGLWNDSALRFHMNKHNGRNLIKRFHCDVCPKGFSRMGAFRVHMARHNGNFHSQCFTCGKVFAGEACLKQHQKVHTGERRFPCRFCDQAFARQRTRQEHERRHTGEKPFKCGTCDKAFTQHAGLHQHLKTHKREKNE